MSDLPATSPGSETSSGTRIGPPTWFWVVSVIALVWNLLGLMAFVMQVTMSEEAMGALPEAQQEIYKSMPSWVTIAFAIGVFAGVLGCIGLLLRAKWAFPVFVLSLLGIIGQQVFMFFLSNTFEVMGAGAMGFPIFVLVVAILLVVFSMSSIRKSWLN